MPTSIISGDDLRYFVQQSPTQLTTIMGQMTTLIQDIADTQNDTTTRVESMEKQGWFKRMWATVSGKNKATKVEIQKNQDKVVSYVSQAVAQCYQMNCIDQQAICSLGNRMNQVYSQVNDLYNEQLQMKAQIAEIQAIQQQTLQALGGFVTKLNEKIESVDNFHMLITEIQQGQYNDSSRLYSLCCILAQLDKRTLDDSRKLGILKEALIQSKIINDTEISISKYLMDILGLPEDKIGVMYLELCNFRNSFPANLFADIIETYHFLPKMEKMSKKKETIVQRLLDKYDLDESAAFSYYDISESFIENKQANIAITDPLQIGINDSSINTTSSGESYNGITNEEIDDKFSKLLNDDELDLAYSYVRPLAEQGFPAAQTGLGLLYQFGWGIEADNNEAFDWFLKAAEQGDPTACCDIAEFYAHTDEIHIAPKVPKNLDKAEYWYIKSAENGDEGDKYDCADFFYSIEKYKDAVKWYNIAIEEGSIGAQESLGDCYWFGNGVGENKSKAKDYWLKAAKEGWETAMFKVGVYYRDVANNKAKAIEWFKKAAENDHLYANICLGDIYRDKQDYSKAYSYFKKAADENEPEAQNYLGLMFDNGEYVSKNSTRAVEWYRKAAEQDFAAAQYNLGCCYYYGDGVNEDKLKAKLWIKKAANQGHESAVEFLNDNF